ncbi:MAG: hypothetical protein NT121_00220, partial [Chloroflexi bacterium]|nr:hypothetical protein [Chloroflexota bacterium]
YNEELDGQSEALKMALQKAVTRLSNLTSLEKQVPKIDDPTLWKAALIKNDFSVLDSIDSLADNLNLSGLVEIQAFIEKLNEFRALSPHFEKACATVREDFITNEDFEKVIRDVTRLKSRPETYKPVNKETRKPENKDVPFHQVGQEEYDLVYQMVGGHFKLVEHPGKLGQMLCALANCRLGVTMLP